nr:hypothetical protein [Bradyrhizobium sp. CSA112]
MVIQQEVFMPTISDAKTFWRALGMRAIGAAVVTAGGSAGPAGFLRTLGDAPEFRSAYHAGLDRQEDIGSCGDR